MKTERITLLGTPQFKNFLQTEARREGKSVGELVRNRCEQRPTEEMAELQLLTRELRLRVADAKRSLRHGLREANAVLKELKGRHRT